MSNRLLTWRLTSVALWALAVSAIIVAAIFVILAYAILGQRVIDVGFAINRAIVYALLTGLMLVGFGIVEWLVDHVLEFEQRKKSALIDGALALSVFLVFHRLQHSIAHAVQHVFFRSWHVRSEALDRFLDASEHFTDPGLSPRRRSKLGRLHRIGGQRLVRTRFAGALRAHSHDAARRSSDAWCQRSGGRETQCVARPASVARSANAGTWRTGPFLARRGKLMGFVRLGEKRNRDVYRPDQIERVSRTVRHVGFDLYALRLEQATATRGLRVTPEPRPASSL